jgi:hypothetical protein
VFTAFTLPGPRGAANDSWRPLKRSEHSEPWPSDGGAFAWDGHRVRMSKGYRGIVPNHLDLECAGVAFKVANLEAVHLAVLIFV